MIHPHTEVRYINDEIGYGLFATQTIPQGTITWVNDPLDREFSPEDLARYDSLIQETILKYSFRNKTGHYVFCWDNGRFINHSFQANCCLTPYRFELAIKNIDAGEELTDDYGFLNIIEPFAADPKGSDRSVVYPDDLLKYADRWDRQWQETLPMLTRVEQPLQSFLPAATRNTITDILTGKRVPDSLKTCYFDPRQV